MVQSPKRGNANVRVLMATPAPPPADAQRPYGEIRAGRIDSAGAPGLAGAAIRGMLDSSAVLWQPVEGPAGYTGAVCGQQ